MNLKTHDPMAAAHSAPRCQHIRLSGARCGSPALKGARLCRLHVRALRPKVPNYSLPFVEDAASAQLALNQVLRALQDKAWDFKTCALMLYDLQIACSNLKRLGEEVPVLPEDDGEPSLAQLLLHKLDQMATETPQDEPSPESSSEWWEKKPPSALPKG